jgi:hypothetical protein
MGDREASGTSVAFVFASVVGLVWFTIARIAAWWNHA